MIDFVEIGVVKAIIMEDKQKAMLIKLHDGFEKACIKLGLFSHCLILSKDDERIYCSPCKIVLVDEKKGEIVVEKADVIGEIIDIKPYFPCEDTIDDKCLEYQNPFDQDVELLDTEKKSSRYVIEYRGDFIGKYIFFQNKEYIRVDNRWVSGGKLDGVSEGDYLRILWWFNGFDKKAMRANRMCQPPYKGAPKTGIFATRSPVRPNPIASTIVKVESVDWANGLIEVNGFDGFDKSPILQIMRYDVEIDRITGVQVPQWVSDWTEYKVFIKSRNIIVNEQDAKATKSGDTRMEVPKYFAELEEGSSADDETVNYNEINIVNASIHNLKSVSVTIPKEKITIITGVSGSGKSSLAFDTIHEESQKQFMDLVSSNAIIGGEINDTKVERITGLQPSIAIEQRNLGQNPRSTIGSLSQVGNFLKLLYATIGTRICPNCHEAVGEDLICKSCGTIIFILTPQHFGHNHPDYMCPVCKGLGLEIRIDASLIIDHPKVSILDGASTWWGNMRRHREKPNANWMRGEVLALAQDMGVDLELPYEDLPKAFRDQILYGSDGREVSLEYKNPNGRSGKITRPVEGVVNAMNRLLKDNNSERSMSYIEKYLTKTKCTRCEGERLREEGRLVHIQGTRFPVAMNMNIVNLRDWCHKIYGELSEDERTKTVALFQKILSQIKRINQVGLGYVSLNRSIPSLSGGEA